MIDFHSHTIFSDGDLLPRELMQRFKVKGYSALGITDHADESNVEHIINRICNFAKDVNKNNDFFIIPGVEITHVPPSIIPEIVKKARKLGAKLIIVHGETIAEPVPQSTNFAALNSDIDILAHPGMITREEVKLAKKNNIYLEITTRRGHAYCNGHVLKLANEIGANLVIDSDTHSPQDIMSKEFVEKVAFGAGMDKKQFLLVQKNAMVLLKKITGNT